jgi:flagellar assembly factor FliW
MCISSLCVGVVFHRPRCVCDGYDFWIPPTIVVAIYLKSTSVVEVVVLVAPADDQGERIVVSVR